MGETNTNQPCTSKQCNVIIGEVCTLNATFWRRMANCDEMDKGHVYLQKPFLTGAKPLADVHDG
jgi:hypothetical protein